MAEFSWLAWLREQVNDSPDDVLGMGDDCCILRPQGDLLVTVDTLVEGVHFLPETSPEAIGHKALAVSLSDIAAMGGKPERLLVALVMPDKDENWFKAFAKGMLKLANKHGVHLVGGDTTQGPLTVTTILHGHVARDKAVQRSDAKINDDIWVTGCLGVAAAGLKWKQAQQINATLHSGDSLFARDLLQEEKNALVQSLDYPEVAVEFAQKLPSLANAAIDISDGLMADLGHILKASGVGATINVDAIPIFSAMRKKIALSLACHGGDDYQLCFTAPPEAREHLLKTAKQQDIKLSRIGVITAELGMCTVDGNNRSVAIEGKSWEHFS